MDFKFVTATKNGFRHAHGKIMDLWQTIRIGAPEIYHKGSDIAMQILEKVINALSGLISAPVKMVAPTVNTIVSVISTILNDLGRIKETAKWIASLARVFMSLSDLLISIPPRYFDFAKMSPIPSVSAPLRWYAFAYDFYNFITLDNSSILTLNLIRGVPQTGETMLFMNLLLNLALPESCKRQLKEFQTFSNFKILEDSSTIFDIFGLIFSIPKVLIEAVFGDKGKIFTKLIQKIEAILPIGSFGKLHYNLQRLQTQYQKDHRKAHDTGFQEEFLEQYLQLKELLEETWDNKKEYPNFILRRFRNYTNLFNKINYCKNHTRREPAFLVFCGPPGTGKSTALKTLIDCYAKTGETIYTHVVTAEGKDFYDQYENETIFVADDVGQMCTAQWSPYINMISTIKFPLPCAVAEKKDTKFFTSNLVCVTTNNIDLTITPDCGITDLRALHRRMQFINYRNVIFDQGITNGEITYEKYSTSKSCFQVVDSLECRNTRMSEIVTWLDKIARNKMTQMRDLFESQRQDISGITLEGLPQSLFEKFKEVIDFIKDWVGETSRNFVETLRGCVFQYTLNTQINRKMAEEFLLDKMIYEEIWNRKLYDRTCQHLDMNIHIPIGTYIDKYGIKTKQTVTATQIYQQLRRINIETGDISVRAALLSLSEQRNKEISNYIKWTFNMPLICCIAALPFIAYLAVSAITNTLQEIGKTINWPLFKGDIDDQQNVTQYIETIDPYGCLDEDILKEALYVCRKKDQMQLLQTTYTSMCANRTKRAYYERDSFKRLKLRGSPQSLDKIFSRKSDVFYPSLDKIKAQVLGIKLVFQREGNCVESESCALFTGEHVLTTAHAIFGSERSIFLSAYLNQDNCVYDNVEVECVYLNQSEDVCLLKLPKNLPKYFRKITFSQFLNTQNYALIGPNFQMKCGKIRQTNMNFVYNRGKFDNTLTPEQYRLYEHSGDSLCGSVLCSANGYLIGLHVAVTTAGEGVYTCITEKTRQEIMDIIGVVEDNVPYFKQLDWQEVKGSVAKVEERANHYPNMSNNIVPSMIHGIVPLVRKPVSFSEKPKELLREFAKLNWGKTATVPCDTLDFATKGVEILLSEARTTVVEDDINISGGGYLNPIDKNTSIGYGLDGVKSDYIDYEKCKLTNIGTILIDKTVDSINNGKIPDYKYSQCFKVELRDAEKADKPRIFKPAPLAHTFLMRRYFMGISNYLHNNRKITGVCVGINPLGKDWDDFYKEINSFSPKVFGADFKNYDKNMLPQVQQRIHFLFIKVLQRTLEKEGKTVEYIKYHLNIAKYILDSLCWTPTVQIDETYITTHSNPSGQAMTAEYNSIVHIFYSLMAFYDLYKRKYNRSPTLSEYFDNVKCYTYGDDGITAVKDGAIEYFNGPEFCKAMAKYGLGVTSEDKSDNWEAPYKTLLETTFLKRGFKFHREIGAFVAPLQIKTMLGTLNYVSDDFRNEELTEMKIQNLQRELYLHGELYEHTWPILKCKIEERGFNFVPLTVDYLLHLYRTDQYGCEDNTE